jgi:hypothetical protein
MAVKNYRNRADVEPFQFSIDDGPTFTARRSIPLLELGDLADLQSVDGASIEGIRAIGKFFEALLGPAEYKRFRDWAANNDVDHDVLLEVIGDAFQAVVGTPQQRPSISIDGPPSTPPILQVVSSSGIRDATREEMARLMTQMAAEAVRGTG